MSNTHNGIFLVNADGTSDEFANNLTGGGSSKQQGYIIPASESATVDSGSTTTVPLTIIGDGAISVTSSDSTKATGSVSNGVLTITGVGGGIDTITITMADSSTYLGTSATVSATSVLNGQTATPTDNIQTWLGCASIFDKSYTTISDALADSSTLGTLISSTNAVDYMVRSTSWATTVCANSTAMSLIGLNNYCANTLLSDSTWLNAIAYSTYIESVMNVKVPTMTSNTTPSGEVIYSKQYNGDQFAYYAFDNNPSTSMQLDAFNNISDNYIGYDFTIQKVVKIVKITQLIDNNVYYFYSWKFEGSNDNSTWVELDEVTANTESAVIRELTNTTAFRYYRCHLVRTLNSAHPYYGIAYEIQFYGREDV